MGIHNHFQELNKPYQAEQSEIDGRTNTERSYGKSETDLSSKIFQYGREIDGSAGTNTFGVLTGLEEASDATNGKLKTSLLRPRNRFRGFGLTPSTFGRSR